MGTQATAYAKTSQFLTTRAMQRENVLSLYRQFMRHAPTFGATYELPYSAAKIRTKIRQEFERNRYATDAGVITVLHAKGQMEFQETINFWKQFPHVYHFFESEEGTVEKPKSDHFVDRFIHGTA